MKKKRRTILIIIIAAVALCILIPVLITAFMGDEPAIYAKYSKLLENGRTYRAIGIDQYVDILEGFESIPGYGDADTLAEETRNPTRQDRLPDTRRKSAATGILTNGSGSPKPPNC